MTIEHDDCIKRGKIKPFSRGVTLAPKEIDTIADIQKLEGLLSNRGYNHENIEAVFHSNWLHFLERTLPA